MHFKHKNTDKLKVNKYKNKDYANTNYKKAREAVLSDKVDFIIRNISSDKDGYFKMIKGLIH